MKKLLLILVGVFFLGLSTFAHTAKADGFDFSLPGRFEVQTGISVGSSFLKQPDWDNLTTNLVVGVRNEHTPLGLGLALNRQGYLTEVSLDIAHGEHWRLPINLGYFKYFDSNKYLSNRDTARSWDLVLGIGTQVSIGKWVITLDWKAFLPDPGMIRQLGFTYRPMLDGAQKAGQLWIGFSRCW